MDEKTDTPPPFLLSASLSTSPPISLRTVTPLSLSLPLCSFITSTTSGVYSQWTFSPSPSPSPSSSYTHSPLFNDTPVHGPKQLCLCTSLLSNDTIASGGSDHLLHILDRQGNLYSSLKGHTGHVNAVCQSPNGDILTGSYDGTAILWRNYEKLAVLSGHTFGVEVAFMKNQSVEPIELNQLNEPNNELNRNPANTPIFDIVTASGDRNRGTLRFWSGLGAPKPEKTIPQAHSHIIRRLLAHPMGVLSCANDGFVKLWSANGELLWSIYAHPQQRDKDPFVYSIAFLSMTGEVASAGEDRTARIISAQGELIQTITHPSPVRDLCFLPNGDLVTVSGDGLARVWTRHPDRVAGQEERDAYSEYLAMADMSEEVMGEEIDPSLLNAVGRLEAPGSRDGQAILVNVPGEGIIAYQWQEKEQKWEKLGQV